MPFYQPDPRRSALPPSYRQGFGPPNQGRQGFGPPNQGRQGFGPPNQGRQGFGPPNQGRQGFGPPNQGRQGFGLPNQGRQGFGPPYQGRQEQRFFDPNQRQNVSSFGRLPDHLNTIMGHAGTIKNGVNMMREIGSFLRSFDGRRP
ncbi:hypothetical protein [Rummeliibacillus pycnus]|uniref:hypothetical protein n=1 Tax=Rummeliibacillus pycnus TaxID=101070 RepID=UPI003D296C93